VQQPSADLHPSAHLLRPPPGMLSTSGMLSAALQGSPHHNPPTPPRTPQAASPLTAAGMPPLLSMAAYMKPSAGSGGGPAGSLPPGLGSPLTKPGGGSGLQGRQNFSSTDLSPFLSGETQGGGLRAGLTHFSCSL
jgi:hypothetical protein